jgi:hypothetical protein
LAVKKSVEEKETILKGTATTVDETLEPVVEDEITRTNIKPRSY